jgi:hypothetical protein
MKLVVVVFCCMISLWTALGQPCPPAAILTGDVIETSAVSALLSARGVSTLVAVGCAPTKVRIIRVEKQLLLEIEDSLGRSSRRLVSTHEAAATVIESWAYDATDILFDDLFPMEARKPETLELSLDESSLPSVFLEVRTATLPESPMLESPSGELALSSWRGATLSVLSEFRVTGGGSLWFGVAANTSKRFGPLQLSLSARYLHKSPLELSSQRAASKAKLTPTATAKCTPIDANGDGLVDFFDCGSCILLDVDMDGSLDDKQCQSGVIPCVTLDINNDGTIDDLQCQQLPQCTTNECEGELQFSQAKSGYGIQGELGLPFAIKGRTITPSIALGVNQFFAKNFGATKALLHAEAFLGFSRRLTAKLRLESRISLSVTPNALTSEGQSAAQLSVGLGWIK